MTTKLECNYCDGEFEVVPLNEIEEEQVAYCPYCGNDIDVEEDEDEEEEDWDEQLTYKNPWVYKAKIFDSDDIGDNYGFVYIITCNTTGKLYIGKKFFYSMKTKQVNKKKKRYKVESDWKEYYGSNEELKKDVERLGKENFLRQIIHVCKTKGTCNYYEAKEQFERDVLLNENYYNSWIQVKVQKSHIKH